jgi:CRP-like cAMP-binding protein
MTKSNHNIDLAGKIQLFSQGDTRILDSPELVETIADYLLKLYHEGDMSQSLLLLERLGEAALNEKIEHRERSLIVLSLVAEKVLEENNEDLLEAIAQMLVRWLKKETEFIAGFEFVCAQLSKIIQKMLDIGLWYQAEDLIAALQSIRIGEIPKDRLFRQIVTRSQRSIAEKRLLDSLTHTFMKKGDDKSDIAGTLLLQFGDNSVPHLLNALLRCQDRSLRYRLLELIPGAGPEATPYLVKELEGSSPWYFTRNLLHIMAKIADPSEVSSITPFLQHEDTRIQREAVEYLHNMQGEIRRIRLLEALNLSSDLLKPDIIDKLGPMQDEEVHQTFLAFLNNISNFEADVQNAIVMNICKYLADYPKNEAVTALQRLRNDPQLHKTLREKTLKLVEKCQTTIERYLQEGKTPEQIGNEKTGQQPNPVRNQQKQKSGEQTTDNSAGLDSDGPQWFQRFCEKADTPEPLKKHLKSRKDLYDQFTHEEFLVFSSLLKHNVYDEGAEITAIGDVHSTLFFFEEGEITIGFPDDDSQSIVHNLKAGDIFGHYIFMNGSEWEVSLTAVAKTEVFTFDQEQLLRLQTVYPNLCQTILKYCKKHDIIMNLLDAATKRAIERASGAPVPFTGNVGDHLADTKITYSDNSGICFYLKMPAGAEPTLFADKDLFISLRGASIETKSLDSKVLGLRFFPQSNNLCIMARFHQETELDGYSIEQISL